LEHLLLHHLVPQVAHNVLLHLGKIFKCIPLNKPLCNCLGLPLLDGDFQRLCCFLCLFGELFNVLEKLMSNLLR
jgi:hypothetical protein